MHVCHVCMYACVHVCMPDSTTGLLAADLQSCNDADLYKRRLSDNGQLTSCRRVADKRQAASKVLACKMSYPIYGQKLD